MIVDLTDCWRWLTGPVRVEDWENIVGGGYMVRRESGVTHLLTPRSLLTLLGLCFLLMVHQDILVDNNNNK